MNFQVGTWVNVSGYIKELKEWKTRTKKNEQYHGVMLALADGGVIKAWVKTQMPLMQGATLSLNGKVSEYEGKIYLDYCSFAPTAAQVAPPVQNYAPKPPESLGAAMPPQYQPAPTPQPTRFPDPEVLRMAEDEVKAKQEADNKERYAEQERQKIRSMSVSYASNFMAQIMAESPHENHDFRELAVEVCEIADVYRIYITSGLWKGPEAEPDINSEPDESEVPF